MKRNHNGMVCTGKDIQSTRILSPLHYIIAGIIGMLYLKEYYVERLLSSIRLSVSIIVDLRQCILLRNLLAENRSNSEEN